MSARLIGIALLSLPAIVHAAGIPEADKIAAAKATWQVCTNYTKTKSDERECIAASVNALNTLDDARANGTIKNALWGHCVDMVGWRTNHLALPMLICVAGG